MDATSTPPASAEGARAARVALGWLLARPSLLAARVALELLALGAAAATAAVVLGAPLGALVAAAPGGALAALDAALGAALSTRHVLSVAATSLACVAVALTSGAASDALAWGEYGDRAQGARARPLDALLREWFARALAWRALRALARLGVGASLGAMYVAALVLPVKMTGAPVAAALLTSLLYAAGLVWGLLTVGAFEIAPAGAISQDMSLGESLYWGAEQVVTRPVTYYRAFVVCAAVMLPGLALTMLGALTGAGGPSALSLSLQAIGQLATLTGACALALAFRAATVALTRPALVSADDHTAQGASRILPSEGADLHMIRLSSLRDHASASGAEEE
jgi:hypothetical protein